MKILCALSVSLLFGLAPVASLAGGKEAAISAQTEAVVLPSAPLEQKPEPRNTHNPLIADELLNALSAIESLQGLFTQQQYDETGAVLSESSGGFRLLRPGFFAWDILSPDSQLVVATPQYLWHYDRDLETVTRRPVSHQGEMSPLQILGGDEAALRSDYSISKTEDGQFILAPRNAGAGFEQLQVSFDAGQLARLQIVDSLSQRIVIVFSDLNADEVLGAADFEFVVPDEADTFYYDE